MEEEEEEEEEGEKKSPKELEEEKNAEKAAQQKMARTWQISNMSLTGNSGWHRNGDRYDCYLDLDCGHCLDKGDDEQKTIT